jgi:hypothetical protein
MIRLVEPRLAIDLRRHRRSLHYRRPRTVTVVEEPPGRTSTSRSRAAGGRNEVVCRA